MFPAAFSKISLNVANGGKQIQNTFHKDHTFSFKVYQYYQYGQTEVQVSDKLVNWRGLCHRLWHTLSFSSE